MIANDRRIAIDSDYLETFFSDRAMVGDRERSYASSYGNYVFSVTLAF